MSGADISLTRFLQLNQCKTAQRKKKRGPLWFIPENIGTFPGCRLFPGLKRQEHGYRNGLLKGEVYVNRNGSILNYSCYRMAVAAFSGIRTAGARFYGTGVNYGGGGLGLVIVILTIWLWLRTALSTISKTIP